MDKKFLELMSKYASEYQAGDRTHETELVEGCFKLVSITLTNKVVAFNSIYGNRVLSLEDLRQTVVTNVLASIASYKPELSFCAWFIAACHNEYNKLYKDAKKQPEVSMDKATEDANGEPCGTLADVIPSDLSVEKEVTNKIIREKVAEEYSRLPEHYHDALDFCYFLGYSRKEAAALMGVSGTTLDNWVKRGYGRLGKYFRKEDFDLES